MNIPIILHTLFHLKSRQIWWQIRYRLFKPKLIASECGEKKGNASFNVDYVPHHSIHSRYCFLNILYTPLSWNDSTKGMLWAYNLNYMDYLLQPGLSKDEGLKLIGKFIDELPGNNVGLDPYPIALRGINWIKWMAANGDSITDEERKKINDSLYSQYRLLEKKLEWHLMGNHLLEDAYSLIIGAIYFNDERMWRKASKLLKGQLCEQILDDGAHYEQSPMYHCILLDRLLDVINFSTSNHRFGRSQTELNAFLMRMAGRMLGHLDSIVWRNGEIPLLNDSAYGISPSPRELKDYAARLGLDWIPVPLRESGYRKFSNDRIEAVVDVGDIMASYQPGHSHADTFNYELRIDGRPFVVDTGISTYDKTPRRQYERSTAAHNTVVINGKDSSQVWSGFRVGRRANVKLICDNSGEVEAEHDGFVSSFHRRRFVMDKDAFCVGDSIKGKGVSLIHLAPDVDVRNVDLNVVETDIAIIKIENAASVTLSDDKASTEYNRFRDIKVVKIEFNGQMTYKIIPNL